MAPIWPDATGSIFGSLCGAGAAVFLPQFFSPAAGGVVTLIGFFSRCSTCGTKSPEVVTLDPKPLVAVPQSDGHRRKGAMPHARVSMIVPASNRAIGYYGIAFFFTGE